MQEPDTNTKVYAQFFIKGISLDPKNVTQSLGISPHYSYGQGDQYGEKKQWIRKRGFWSISSENQIEPIDPGLHIGWILDQLEPVRSELLSLLAQEDIQAQLSIVILLFDREWSINIPPNLLNRINNLKIAMGTSVYYLRYPDEEE